MAESIDTSTVLLTEHLRYAPISLIDDIINSINELSYKAVDSVEQGLHSAPLSVLGFRDTPERADGSGGRSAEEKAKQEIENGTHKLETLLEAAIDKNFDIMEIFALRNMLAIPDDLKDWIQLRHYEGLNFDIAPDAPTMESITLQRKKLRESQRLQRLLQAESAKNTALINNLKALRSSTSNLRPSDPSTTDASTSTTSPFAFLSQTGELPGGSVSAPLSTTTSFALSQLPALKSLLAELQPQLKVLSTEKRIDPNVATRAEDETAKSARRQRVEYIETQTKRHLENVTGFELGSMGEAKDGDWQSQGRKLAKGEVDDLERLVGALRGTASSTDRMDEAT